MQRRVFTLLMPVLIALCAAPAFATEWRVPGNFVDIQTAIDSPSVLPGDVIIVEAGAHHGAIVRKAVEIKGEDGATIIGGPLHPSGFAMGFFFEGNGVGSGATITHLRFEAVPFPVLSRGANDVTVTHNVMLCPLQGVTNWGGGFGNGWTITHNDIVDLRTSNGGGIGILIGDRTGGPPVSDNVVEHNKITGKLHMGEGEEGHYNGSGIVLYADFRYGYAVIDISFNRVNKNTVSMTSDNPDLVDIVAFEMTDTRADASKCVIHDNAVAFNDFRGTKQQIVLTPVTLEKSNNISRNFGDNRGRGLLPKQMLRPLK